MRLIYLPRSFDPDVDKKVGKDESSERTFPNL